MSFLDALGNGRFGAMSSLLELVLLRGSTWGSSTKPEVIEELESFEMGSDESVNRLRDKDEVQCVICLCDYSMGEQIKRLPCGHCFHQTCVVEWLSSRNTCPCCRFELPKASPRDSEIEVITFFVTLLEIESGHESAWIQVHASPYRAAPMRIHELPLLEDPPMFEEDLFEEETDDNLYDVIEEIDDPSIIDVEQQQLSSTNFHEMSNSILEATDLPFGLSDLN